MNFRQNCDFGPKMNFNTIPQYMLVLTILPELNSKMELVASKLKKTSKVLIKEHLQLSVLYFDESGIVQKLFLEESRNI